ncbi:MAG TPA: MFS transporter [Acidimicrobiales bacterium]|nr:MFS transporter [Acidimicrobiales bacterium]
MALTSLAPLRHRSYALSATSSFVSSIGTWMQSVALGVYLTVTTHNTIWLGLITVAQWLPAIVGSPLGGVVADRWNRQHWIQSCNVVMALTSGSLAYLELTHHLHPIYAVYLAVGEGFASSASWAAFQSLLPDLVEPHEVLAAVSLGSAQFNLGRVIGPIFAAVALSLGSPGICFFLNALSFVFVIVMFSFVRTKARPRVESKFRFFAETKVGARRAWALAGCRNPIVGVGVVAFIVSPFISLVPAMAIDVLHAGKVGTSWLVTAQGLGAVTGALTLPTLAKRTSRLFVLRGSLATLVVADALYALAPSLAWSIVALYVVGGAYVGSLTGLNTTVQLHAPVAERSRILALYTLSLSIFFPFGALLQSALAKAWGVRTVTLSAAALLGSLLVLVLWRAPSYFRAMDSPRVASTVLLAD